MPINPSIPLQGQVANPLNALASGYQLGNTIRQQPMVDKMNQQKLQAGEIELKDAKMKMQEAAKDARVKSAIMGAAELQSAPVEQWANILQDRIKGASRYAYDAEAEKEALQILQTKGPEALKAQVDGLVKFGGAMGLLGARKGTYGALTPAIGPDGKPVYIQSDPSGGQPNVVQGYAPMPTAADQAAALQAQQNAAMARLLSGGVGGQGGQGGPILSPNAPAGSTNPFAGMSAADIAMLPPEIQKKAFESMTDPKRNQEQRESQLSKVEASTKGANAFELIDSVITDPALSMSTGFTGMVYRSLPGTSGKRVDANIMRLKGATFLQGIESIRGMGALSNVEGEKVTAAAAAIDPQMDETDLRNELVRLRGQVTEGIRNTWVVDNPDIPANDIDMLMQRPDLAQSFKEMYGRLPRGFERVQGYLKGPQPTGKENAASTTGGSGIKFVGFE